MCTCVCVRVHVCVAVAQQLGMAPRSLTRHAVPLTNSRRATATCVSRPCPSHPPPHRPDPSSTPPPPEPAPASHATPAPTHSSTVYLMNSTLGAAGFFLILFHQNCVEGGGKKRGTAPSDLFGPSETINSLTLSSGVLWARSGWQISHFHNIRC